MSGQPPVESRILVAAARRRLDADGAARLARLLEEAGLLEEGPAWRPLLEAAERHRVIVLLLWSLEALGHPRVSTRVLDHLRARARGIHAANLVLTAELYRCLDILADAGIEAIPYKGPVLGVVAYGDPAARVFGDLDIVVRRADAPRAFEALHARGYRPYHAVAPGRAERFFRFHCEHGFWGPSGARLELHWGFLPAYLSTDFTPDFVWERLTTVDLMGRSVRHFETLDLVLVLAVHGYKHFWSRLEWLCAVHEILRAHPELDGAALPARARVTGTERILGLALRLAGEILGAPVPAPCRPAAYDDAAVTRSFHAARALLLSPAEPRPGFWRRTRLRLQTRERLRDRARYWVRLTAGMEPMGTWPREPAWGPVDRLLRPLRLLRLVVDRSGRGEGP